MTLSRKYGELSLESLHTWQWLLVEMRPNSFRIQSSKKDELYSGKILCHAYSISFLSFFDKYKPCNSRWKDSSLDLRIPEDATEEWIKEEIFLQETILNKLHNYMQGKKVSKTINCPQTVLYWIKSIVSHSKL